MKAQREFSFFFSKLQIWSIRQIYFPNFHLSRFMVNVRKAAGVIVLYNNNNNNNKEDEETIPSNDIDSIKAT